MDAMMADHRLLYVDQQTTESVEYFDDLPLGCEVADISATPITCTDPYTNGQQGQDKKFEYLHPPFLRIGKSDIPPGTGTPTKMCYEWDATGFVTQFQRDDDGNCP